MFATYLALIAAGLTLYIVVGIRHL